MSAFLLAGHIPFVLDWAEFVDYFRRMRDFRIVESIRDFCYTPLTVRRAACEASTATTASRPAASVTPARSSTPTARMQGDILDTLAIVAAHASVLGSRELLEELERLVCAADSDADCLRARRSE